MQFRMCDRCVLNYPEVPDIVFDERGVCNYCNEYERRQQAWRHEKTNLPWRLERIRKDGAGKRYDVLCGLSGGADSSYTLHLLKQHDIRPLCWSMDHKFNDPRADENVMRLVEGIRVPFIKRVLAIDRFMDLYASLIKAGIKNLEASYDHILYALSYRLAREYGIKWIVNGGNTATEFVMPAVYGHDAKDLKLLTHVYRLHTGRNLRRDLPTMSLSEYIINRFVRRIGVFQPLDYIDYNREKAIQTLTREYGYKPYGEKHEESVLTALFQAFYLPTKFNLDKRKCHYSSMILSGQMTKKEALKRLAYPPIYPSVPKIERLMTQYPKAKNDIFSLPNDQWKWKFLQSLYAYYRRSL